MTRRKGLGFVVGYADDRVDGGDWEDVIRSCVEVYFLAEFPNSLLK